MTETKKTGKPYDLEGFKKATGGDHIQAWILYKGTINFKPTASQVLNFNDWPRLTSIGSDVKRRLGHFIIEFKKNYDDEIVGLVDKIIEYELPGVLAWAIDGVISYFRDGADDVHSLRMFDHWVGSFDPITAFTEECIESTGMGGGMISRPALWAMYKKWCDDAGFEPGNKSDLNYEMKKRYGDTVKSNGVEHYVGVIASAAGRDLAKLAGINTIDKIGRRRGLRS
jgi:phage/plasmid-associated DNA primase